LLKPIFLVKPNGLYSGALAKRWLLARGCDMRCCGFRRRSRYGGLNTVACQERTCALRAPTVFSVQMDFHPCAIDDPRGRFLVRATSQLCNNAGLGLSRDV